MKFVRIIRDESQRYVTPRLPRDQPEGWRCRGVRLSRERSLTTTEARELRTPESHHTAVAGMSQSKSRTASRKSPPLRDPSR